MGDPHAPAGTGRQRDRGAGEAEQRERAQRRRAEPQRETPVGGGGHGQRDERRRDAGIGRHQRTRGACSLRDQRVAEQRAAGDACRPPERPEREGERGQQSIAGGKRQRAGIDPQHGRDRQNIPEPRGQYAWQGRAEDKTDQYATACERQHLDDADGEHQPRRTAEAAQRRKRGGPRVEPCAHSVGDADAADQQRGQAHQGHEQAGLVDEAGHAGCGVARLPDAPALAGERLAECRQQSGRRGRVRERRPERVLHHGTGGDQPGRSQGSGGDQHAGAEDQRRGDPVGLRDQFAADREACVAQTDGIAGMQVEPIQHDALGQQAVVRKRHGDRAPSPTLPRKAGEGVY